MASFNLPKTTSIAKITILVVDDDATSLAIVAAMLRKRYKVTAVKSPHDALSTLRACPGIDLVVSDLHMPGMDGLQLKRQIDDEFKLPVIIMSSDDKESVILHSLACGAVFYMVKPVNPDDLKNLWRYAVQSKKGKSVVIEEIGTLQEEQSKSSQRNKMSEADDDHTRDSNSDFSSVNNDDRKGEKQDKNDGKRKRKGKDGNDNDELPVAPKKAKVLWTNALHNRFLQAIKQIGLDKAVPKKILECMNVSGLTRENVASHLQKYRMFLKRVAEKGLCPSKTLNERALRSNFAAGYVTMLQDARQEFSLSQQQRKGELNFHPGYGGSSTLTLRLPGQGPSSSSGSTPSLGPSLLGHQFGYGRSNFGLSLANNRQQQQFDRTGSFSYQTNGRGFGDGSNNFSRNGGFSSGVINPISNSMTKGTNLSSMHMYPQRGTQARPDLYNVDGCNTSSAQYQFGASTFNNINSPNTSSLGGIYTGTRMSGNGEFRLGHFQFSSTNSGSTGTGGHGNGNMNVAPMLGNENSGNLSQESFFSAGNDQVSSQVPPPVPPLATTNNQPGSTSILPPMSEGLSAVGTGGKNDPNFNFLNNASIFGDNIDSLFDSTNLEFPFQVQQDGENVLNPDIASISNFGDLHQIVNQFLNPDLFGSAGTFFVDGGHQLENNSSTAANNISPLGEYRPLFDPNANQRQNGGETTMNSEPKANNIYPMNNAPQNQSWSDEFMDLFCFSP